MFIYAVKLSCNPSDLPEDTKNLLESVLGDDVTVNYDKKWGWDLVYSRGVPLTETMKAAMVKIGPVESIYSFEPKE